MNNSALASSLAQNCTDKFREGDYLTSYNIFVWTLSGLIIVANILLITVILKSSGLRNQVTICNNFQIQVIKLGMLDGFKTVLDLTK